jgi:hypothetical protein
MMVDKNELIASLRSVYDNWEELLGGIGEEEVTRPRFKADWSVQDVVTHLWAWQQISIARFAAAVLDNKPEFPAWLAGTDPSIAEEHTDEFNARIRAENQGRAWTEVHQDWSEGFLRLIDLAEQTPEDAMFEEGRYPWLKGYPLSAVLSGSREHHEEHLEDLSTALT